MFIKAKGFTGRAEEGQKSRGQGIDEPQTITPFGRADAALSHAKTKARILGIAEGRLDPPALGILGQQALGLYVFETGTKTPRSLHVLGLYANSGTDGITIRRPRTASKNAHPATSAYPIRGAARLAFGRRDLDIAAETYEVIELQFVRQHLIKFVIAKTAIATIRTSTSEGSASARRTRTVCS